jgi:ribonuclease HII
MIVGIDEVGRGPWAGPLVFGAVVLGDADIPGLTDSKKLTKTRREALDVLIRTKATAIGLGWVEAREIDDLGMSRSLTLACRRALEQITVPYEQIIIDGTVNFLSDTGKGPYVTTMKQADLLVPSVSAASIVAKVARDRFMTEQDTVFPGYNFAAHSGYGTAGHRSAIEVHGVTPLHRLSFSPLQKYRDRTVSPMVPSPSAKGIKAQPTSSGEQGENAAARYLQDKGYRIIARNWRNKIAEIDIVAERSERLYFVEVKYRKSEKQGGGLAAITPQKLHHMRRAARAWLQRYGDQDATLAVIEVSGQQFEVTEFLEQV